MVIFYKPNMVDIFITLFLRLSFFVTITWSDMYQQLSTPAIAPTTFSSMKFTGALGPEGNVLAATSSTITVPAITQTSNGDV